MFSFFSFLFFLSLLYLCFLILLAGDVHVHPGPRRQLSRICYSNIRGLKRNFLELSLISSDFDIIFCSETMVSNRRDVSEILIPGFNKPVQIRCGTIPSARGMCAYIKSGLNAVRCPAYECGCHEVMTVKLTSRFSNYYIFAIYRNPHLDDAIFDCLLQSMARIQEVDRRSAFIFVGDFNAHHRDWLSSISPTDGHGRAALDFANLSDCEQLVHEPTHTSGNCLDLVLTDVPGVVDVTVLPPIGYSDHSGILLEVQTNSVLPNFSYSRSVFMKSRINWEGVRNDVSNIVWRDILHAPSPVDSLNDALQHIFERRVPRRTIRTRSKDAAWFNDDCRRAYRDKQCAYRRWSRSRSRESWDNYINERSVAQDVYVLAETQYHSHLKDLLTGTSQSHTWWSALKQSLFGCDSSLPPLRKPDGSTCFDPTEKANLLATVFDGKQSDSALDLPDTCFPEELLCSLAFRTSELQSLLDDLDPYGGCDPLGCHPVFYKGISSLIAPKLSVIFRGLIRRGEFPQCWRTANVTPIPKGYTPSVLPQDYRPISITPILSKVYERLLARRILGYAEKLKLLPQFQFGFRKGLSANEALLLIAQDLQGSLDRGHESRLVSLDFSSAFDLVNHDALIYKLRSVGVGGSFCNILSEFLNGRKQRVLVDGCYSSFINVKSGVPQGSVLGPLLFIIFTADMWDGIASNMVAYADDASLYAPITSPNDRARIANVLGDDLKTISSWCSRWGMKLNPSKSLNMIVSRSRTAFPQHPDLLVDGSVVPVCGTMKLLGVTLDSKLTFEQHLRNVASSASRRVGLLRKCRKIYADSDVAKHCFYSFMLPHFEYCSSVWMSAADCHLNLLNRAMNRIRFLLPDLDVNLDHRRVVGSLTVLFKIFSRPEHPLHSRLPLPFVSARPTRHSIALNDRAFKLDRHCTNQFSRCFFPALSKRWNELPNSVVLSESCDLFKTRVNAFLLANPVA